MKKAYQRGAISAQPQSRAFRHQIAGPDGNVIRTFLVLGCSEAEGELCSALESS